jgi:hypothetical protein
MRSYPEDTSIKIPANGWFLLFSSRRKNPAVPEAVQFRKPFAGIWNYRLKKNPLLDAAHTDSFSFKAEFFGETDGLAAAVLEQFCGFGFGHGNSIYQRDLPRQGERAACSLVERAKGSVGGLTRVEDAAG